MHRRAFLKAMGLSGMLYAANWKTLVRGPVPGCRILRGYFRSQVSFFTIAGETLKAGDIVTVGHDGKLFKARCSDDFEVMLGIALTNSGQDTSVEVSVMGGGYFQH